MHHRQKTCITDKICQRQPRDVTQHRWHRHCRQRDSCALPALAAALLSWQHLQTDTDTAFHVKVTCNKLVTWHIRLQTCDMTQTQHYRHRHTRYRHRHRQSITDRHSIQDTRQLHCQTARQYHFPHTQSMWQAQSITDTALQTQTRHHSIADSTQTQTRCRYRHRQDIDIWYR
jgi:hypothetical protein